MPAHRAALRLACALVLALPLLAATPPAATPPPLAPPAPALPAPALPAPALPAAPVADSLVLDDFETYAPGTFPDRWTYVVNKRKTVSYEEAREPGESFLVREEDGNQFLRSHVERESHRYTRRNGLDGYVWNLSAHPHLAWRWRVNTFPEGASERDENDVAAAVYVTFGTDWLGRPKSIKYTYSTSLAPGTTVSFGPLKVIVVDSVAASETGTWHTAERNVAADYRRVFGDDPPDEPVSITLWSDSDDTNTTAEADFDDLYLVDPSGENGR
jgi:hypothetical protein